ncbi:response regulator transcription factor [Kineococcus glutinatus]|uniref:Response regulator n=1 Tax=Kineococcus glutinatus TaxID=1070872 RepID=A0ABP9HX74_9ACTN
MSAGLRVLLVDDHDLLRAGLVALLSAADDITVVGEATDGPSAVRAVAQLEPDVVLMDVQMPGGEGITATGRIVSTRPATRVLVLTTFDLDDYVFRALRAGASGFLLKTAPPADLVHAIRAGAAGELQLAPSVLRRLVDSYVENPPPAQRPRPPGLDELTPRELDVLGVLATGASNAEIGAQLHLAETTVKSHVTHVLAKLRLRDRVQAVVVAHEHGLAGRGARP